MMRLFIIFFVLNSQFSIFNSPVFAQFYGLPFLPAVDTLYEQLARAKGDERTRILNGLAFYHSFENVDSTYWYAEQALELARERNDRQEEARALRHIGNGLVLESRFREAIGRFYESLAIFEEMQYKRGIIEALSSVAKVNYDAGDFQQASAYVDLIVPLLEETSPENSVLLNPTEKAQLIASIAVVKRENREYEEAVRYFKQYQELSEDLDVSGYLLLHIAYVQSLGETFEFMGELDSAMKYILLARDLMPQNAGRGEEEKSGREMTIGTLYSMMGEYPKAITYLERALQDYLKDSLYMYSSWCFSRLGSIYRKQGHPSLALSHYRQALVYAGYLMHPPVPQGKQRSQPLVYSGYQLLYLKISEKWVIQKYYETMIGALKGLHALFLHQGDSAQAYRYFVDLTAYRDSLNTLEQDIEFSRMQLRYESDQLEQQVTILSQENELRYMQLRRTIWLVSGGGVFVLLMILFGLMWFRQKQLRDRQHALELEQRLMRTQMNPHFIFNSLASIQNFIVTQEPMKASTYLSRFANLVRSILDNSVEEFIPFEDEIKTIENYLALQKVRYADKFDYTIEVDPAIDAESMMIPPMLAQPFIENSIEHGFKQKTTTGRLSIRILKSSDDLILFEVEDDGVGREKARQLLQSSDPKHRSMATSITRERLAVLNRKLKHKITLGIIDLKDEEGNPTGTLVRFGIPVKMYT